MSPTARKTRLAPAFLAFLFGAITAAAAQTGAEPTYDTYKSWLVACDNTLRCQAKGFTPDDGAAADLLLTRDAGPDGALSLRFEATDAFSLQDITLDGAPLDLDPADWRAVKNDDDTVIQEATDPAAVRRLVDALRNGTEISLGEAGTIPLAGFTAALVRVDERQGRLGNETALLRVGAAPASRVPPALDLPAVPNRPVASALAEGEAARLAKGARPAVSAIAKNEDCQDEQLREAPQAFALNETQALLVFSCGVYPYNSAEILMLSDRKSGAPKRLTLSAPYGGNGDDHGQNELTIFSLTEFDPKTGVLSTFNKGRGIGDCGESERWTWTGSAFVLSEQAMQLACGGATANWPALVRTRS